MGARLITLAFLTVAVMPATARAQMWNAPVSLTAPVAGHPQPRVAVDARGDTVVTWLDGVEYAQEALAEAYRPAGGAFGPRTPVVVGGRGEFIAPASPVVSPDGTATFAWIRHPSVQTAQRRPDGRLSAPHDLAPDPTGLDIGAGGGAGGVALAWPLPDGVHEAHGGAGDPLGSPLLLGGGTIAFGRPAVALGARGDELVAWSDDAGHLDVAHRPSGGAFTAPAALPGVSGSAYEGVSDPQVAVNATGEELIAWTQGSEVRAAFGRDGSFGPIEDVGPGGLTAIALNDRGDAALALSGGNVPRTQVAFRSPGGAFAAPVAVGGCDGQSSTVVLDGSGDALVAWYEAPEINRPGVAHLAAAIRPAGGALGAPETITTQPSPEIYSPLSAGVDGAGRVTLGWVSQPRAGSLVGSGVVNASTTTAPIGSLARTVKVAPPGDPASCHPARPLAAAPPSAPHVDLGSFVRAPRSARAALRVACPRRANSACVGALTVTARTGGRLVTAPGTPFTLAPGTGRAVALHPPPALAAALRARRVGRVTAQAETGVPGGTPTTSRRLVGVGRPLPDGVRSLGPASGLWRGTGLVGFAPVPGTTRLVEPGTGETIDVATPYTCRPEAVGAGRLLFGCPKDDLDPGEYEYPEVFDVASARWSLPGPFTEYGGFMGRVFHAIGTEWIRAGVSGYHYADAPEYLPYRAGGAAHETRLTDGQYADLDAPSLVKSVCDGLPARVRGSRFLYDRPYALQFRSGKGRPLELERCGHLGSTRLSRCRRGCSAVYLNGGWATWIEDGRVHAAAGNHPRRAHVVVLPRGLRATDAAHAGGRAFVLARGIRGARLYSAPLRRGP